MWGCKMYNKSLEITLEELLEKAFEQVTYRPQFLQQLLDSYIYILGTSAESISEHIEHTLKEGSEVQIKQWQKKDGTFFFPFFTSLERLQKTIRNNENYLRINTRSFFELTFGSHVVLNPYSEIGKEFLPAEIAGLLNGDFGLRPDVEELTIDPNTQLSHPSPYPINMVEQIKILLQVNHAVSFAYLAQVMDEKHATKSSLVIGLQLSQVLTEHEKQQLYRQVKQTATDSLLQKKTVELVFVDANDQTALGQYLLHQTQPFYLRQDDKKKGFFATLFN
ncbi:enhanced serine sensitivity protein SseB [Acinetobacter sp. WCHAc060025]|nr:enhanced serine sensitivity protein SseB [Acinetobacter sp. WCHAc060025]